MHFGKGAHQRQAQACAGLGRPRIVSDLDKGISQAVDLFRGNTDSGIAHGQDDMIARSDRFRDNLAAARREFHGVGKQIEHDLFHRSAVGPDEIGH